MTHVVFPPLQGPSGSWHARCLCGATATAGSHDEAAAGLATCRAANGAPAVTETREQRLMRRQLRREQRRSNPRHVRKSEVEREGRGMRK